MARVYTRVYTGVYTTSVHKSSKLDTKKVIAMTDCHKAKRYFGDITKAINAASEILSIAVVFVT